MSRRPGLAPLLLSFLVLAACGAQDDVVVFRRFDTPPAGWRLEVRVLDPGGRAYEHLRGPVVCLHDPATGEVQEGARFRNVPPGAELVVLAPGCRPTRVPAQSEGIQYVRLEPGLRIRLRLVGNGPVPAGLTGLDLGLVRKPRPDAWWAGQVHERRAAGARWLEDDLPVSNGDHVHVPSDAAELVLYVPGPGTYRIGWHTGWTNHGMTWGTGDELEIGADDADRAFDVEVPVARLEKLGMRARGELQR